MHCPALGDVGRVGVGVVVAPQGGCIVADVTTSDVRDVQFWMGIGGNLLNGHQADAGEKAHEREEEPELGVHE